MYRVSVLILLLSSRQLFWHWICRNTYGCSLTRKHIFTFSWLFVLVSQLFLFRLYSLSLFSPSIHMAAPLHSPSSAISLSLLPLFLSFLFRQAEQCLFLSSISVLLYVSPLSPSAPPAPLHTHTHTTSSFPHVSLLFLRGPVLIQYSSSNLLYCLL